MIEVEIKKATIYLVENDLYLLAFFNSSGWKGYVRKWDAMAASLPMNWIVV